MPEIIDVLTLDIADCPSFVADNTVDFVSPVVVATPVFKNSQGNSIFSKGDSFEVVSCGLIFPEQFGLSVRAAGASALPVFGLLIKGNPTGAIYFNPSFSGSELFLPMENYEFIIDVYCNCQDTYKGGDRSLNLFKENFVITSYLGGIDVSMFNIPAAINGKTFYIVPFIKVLHNSILA